MEQYESYHIRRTEQYFEQETKPLVCRAANVSQSIATLFVMVNVLSDFLRYALPYNQNCIIRELHANMVLEV